MRRRPSPPVGIRLEYRDGTTQEVEAFYSGKRGRTHVWTVTMQPSLVDFTGLSIDILPAHTEVELFVAVT